MQTRSILTRVLPLLACGLLVACDKAPEVEDAKADLETEPADAKSDPAPEAGGDAAEAVVAGGTGGDEGLDGTGDEADGTGAGAKAAPPDGGIKTAAGKPDGDKSSGDKSSGGKSSDGKSSDGKSDGGGANASAAAGKEIFRKKCKTCHGIRGAADTKMGKKHDIPDWTQPGWKSKWPLPKIEDIVKSGKSGTKMKAFEDKLSPEEIQAVSKYARSLGK